MSKIVVEQRTDPAFDCECCGWCFPEGVRVHYNEELVWERFSDGHMYGHQTEEPLIHCLVSAWKRVHEQQLAQKYTEEARHAWNKNHPGNGIARTPQSWEEEYQKSRAYMETVAATVTEHCRELPCEELLQARLFSVWLQDACGEEVAVEQR